MISHRRRKAARALPRDPSETDLGAVCRGRRRRPAGQRAVRGLGGSGGPAPGEEPRRRADPARRLVRPARPGVARGDRARGARGPAPGTRGARRRGAHRSRRDRAGAAGCRCGRAGLPGQGRGRPGAADPFRAVRDPAPSGGAPGTRAVPGGAARVRDHPARARSAAPPAPRRGASGGPGRLPRGAGRAAGWGLLRRGGARGRLDRRRGWRRRRSWAGRGSTRRDPAYRVADGCPGRAPREQGAGGGGARARRRAGPAGDVHDARDGRGGERPTGDGPVPVRAPGTLPARCADRRPAGDEPRAGPRYPGVRHLAAGARRVDRRLAGGDVHRRADRGDGGRRLGSPGSGGPAGDHGGPGATRRQGRRPLGARRPGAGVGPGAARGRPRRRRRSCRARFARRGGSVSGVVESSATAGRRPVVRPGSLRAWLRVGLVTGGALLGLVAALAATALVIMQDRQHAIIDVYFAAITEADTSHITLLDAEASVRGYAMTGNPVSLEALERITGQSAANADKYGAETLLIAELDKGDPALAARQAAVEAVATWFADFAQPLLDTVEDDGPGSVSDTEIAAGQEQFAQAEALVERYTELLRAERASAVAELRTWLEVVTGAFAVLALSGIVLGALLWVFVRRWVTDPLMELAADARRVAGGEVRHSVDETGPG